MTRAVRTGSHRAERRTGLGHPEAVLVERRADDDAGQVPAAATPGRPAPRGRRGCRRRRRRSTGIVVRSSTARSPSTSGPSSVPSRVISVTITASTPASSNRRSTSSTLTAGAVEPAAHGGHAPARSSSPTATGWRAAIRRTRSGSSIAAVPMTTRATPASASAAAASSERTPPPVCTGTPCDPDGRGDGADDVAVDGSPLRAASRSTTWIHRAPAAANAGGHGDRIVAVDGLGVVVALTRRTACPPRRSMAGYRSTPVMPPPRLVADEVAPAGRGRPAADFSGWNCVAPTLSRSHGGDDAVRRSRTWPPRHRRRRARREGVHEVHPRPVVERRRSIGSPGRVSVSRFHCICGRFTVAGSSRTVPGRTPRPTAPGSLLAAVEQHLHADADPEERPARCRRPRGRRRRGRASSQRLHAPPKAPTPGSTTAAASAHEAAVGGEAGVGAEVLAAPSGPSAGCRCRSRARRRAAARLRARPWWTARRRPRPARRRAGSGPGP